jgi:hypothetical protein
MFGVARATFKVTIAGVGINLVRSEVVIKTSFLSRSSELLINSGSKIGFYVL